MDCESCRFYQPTHEDCEQLLGHLWCPECKATFAIKGSSVFCDCGAKGIDKAVEDVSNGQPEHCPGWQSRTIVKTQQSLFA